MRRLALLATLLWASTAQADIGLLLLGAQSPPHYPLDGLTAPSGAYALQRLLTSYSTNKLVRLRRTSDNAEADIGFDASGAIDTATASTHCTAGSDPCFVKTWYDQSGVARDLVQATAGNQPAFIFGCLGTSPCVRTTAATQTLATAGNFTPASGVVSISLVLNRSSGTGICSFRENVTNNRLQSANATANAVSLIGGGGGTINKTATDAAWHAALGVINGASSLVNVDNNESAPSTVTGNTPAGTVNITPANSTTCNFVSAIFFDNVVLTATERAMVVNNQRAWWGF